MTIVKHGITSQIISSATPLQEIQISQRIRLPYNYASLQLLMLSQLILHSLSFQPSEMLKNSSACEQILVYSLVSDWLWQYGLCVYFPFLRKRMIAAALFHSFLIKAMKASCE